MLQEVIQAQNDVIIANQNNQNGVISSQNEAILENPRALLARAYEKSPVVEPDRDLIAAKSMAVERAGQNAGVRI